MDCIDDWPSRYHRRAQPPGEEAEPVLNEEHDEFTWAPLSDPPRPLHPGVARTLSKLAPGVPVIDAAQDRREYDTNGWFEVLDNPLSTVGVYPYSEASVRKGGDPLKMVGVLRPESELSDPETVKSFRLMPWTDDHPDALLGDPSQGLVAAESKGVHGVIGEKTYYRDGTLYGNLKVFSEEQARKIASGKRELSCGYRCDFVPSEGVYEGTPYQYVQKNLRGNHVASVRAGRMGAGVRVLDAAEPLTLSFALDLKETAVAKDSETACTICGRTHAAEADCMDADTLKMVGDSFNSLVGELERKGYSKEYATKVAGKVAAEKGMTGHDSNPTGDTTVAKDAKDEEVKDPVKKDDAPSDLKGGSKSKDKAKDKARDGESEESEEEAKDADPEEEADDEDEDDKMAKDDDDKPAFMKGKDKAKDAKGRGMDAAEVQALVSSEVAKAVAAVGPTLRREEAAKNTLYGRLSPIIGAFDHSEMTLPAMAQYGLEKLGVAAKAPDPVTALDFMLLGRSQVAAAAAPGARAAALDSGDASFVDKYIAA